MGHCGGQTLLLTLLLFEGLLAPIQGSVHWTQFPRALPEASVGRPVGALKEKVTRADPS